MLIKTLLLLIISFPAFGYKLTEDFTNGFYWASLPIKFVILEKDQERKLLLDELASSAIEEWEKESGFSLWDLKTEGTNNIIRWSTNFANETGMDPTSVLAVAIRYTDGPYFAKSEIIINGNHSAFNTPFKNVNEMNIATTLVHELGHTMGLDHSENVLAVMAPTLQYPYNGLHSDDLDGMKEVFNETDHRQAVRFISPLAFAEKKEEVRPVSCGTTTTTGSMGLLSMALGVLTVFVRELIKWFKSLF